MPLLPAARAIAAIALVLIAVLAAAQDYETGRQAYLEGDYARALEILEPLAERGDSDAQVTLGLMYDHGHGVDRDPAKAIDWYTRAAEQGLPVVQHDLGVKYFQGKGVPRDYQRAAQWWEQAASTGLADSQFNLGLLHYRGLGIEKNHARALELFHAAAEQGHANAQYSLAVMYAFGQGTDRDYGRALELFRAAAEQGIAQAQYNLGVFYENGHGVEKDPVAARRWYEKAAAGNVAKARERLAALQQASAAAGESRPASLPGQAGNGSDTSQTEPELRRDAWVLRQPANDYTLQLISLTDEQAVHDYLLENRLAGEGGYIAVTINNVRRYNAIYGRYDSYDEARRAIDSLPESVRQGKPWVRNFGVLQKVMQ